MPPKILLRTGLGFLFLALIVYLSSERWLKTRNFVPLDVPVSLDTRQIKSPPFEINLRNTYFVALQMDSNVDDWYSDGRCNDRALLGSRWRVYSLSAKSGQQRRLWDSSRRADPRLGIPLRQIRRCFRAVRGGVGFIARPQLVLTPAILIL